MILEYTDIFDGGKVQRIKAKITTDHTASRYGLPVIVLDDGGCLDAQSWVLLNYRIVSANKSEAPMLERWLQNLYAMLGMSTPSLMGRKGGSSKSDRKQSASRKNGLKGGRPKKQD